MIVRRFKANMVPGGRAEVVNLSQYDSDVVLEFELYTTEGVFTVAEGTTVLFRGSKPDGNGISIDAELESTVDAETGQTVHVVTVELNQQVTAVAGRSFYELSLRKDDVELNTANFIIDVERAPLDKDTPPSNSVIKEIIDTIDRTDEFLGAARSIAADREIVEQKTEDAEAAAASAEDALEQVNTKAQQIMQVTTSAEEIATEALNTANNAQNHMADLDSQMQEVKTALDNVSIDPDDLGLYQDEDTMYVYPTYKGIRSENGIPLASKGGGGGGGEVITAVLTVENTSGWLSKTISAGSSCEVSFRWSSVDDGLPTGDGTLRITNNEVVRSTQQIQQGNVIIDLKPYLTTGTNKVKVRISDSSDQGKTITFNITAIELSISSSFDSGKAYSGAFLFPFTPIGAVDKTVYFILDDQQIGTQETAVSNREMSYSIPAQSHGAHSLRVFFTAEINNETVRSNELYFEFVYVDPMDSTVIITSNFAEETRQQYDTIPFTFRVYDPLNVQAPEVKLYINDDPLTTLKNVPRTEQSYAYQANTAGPLEFKIECGHTEKTISLTVTPSEIDIHPETNSLALYLTSKGRSNTEEHPEVWKDEDNNISATLTGFGWTSDGWQSDEDGITCLRVSGDARVTIPYQLFGADFRGTGKTIEIEFATRNVLDYDAPIFSCLNGGRGLTFTAQNATLSSEQSTIGVQYKEDEHIRLSFVAGKNNEYAAKNVMGGLLMVYIDTIPSGVIQYPENDNFQQASPVGISIGSNACTIDIYNIRIYDNNLTRQQILDNYIADTQIGSLMRERFVRNQVYDTHGNVITANLPSSLPYMILEAEELPQYKGDKKTGCSVRFVNPMYPSMSFTALNNVQLNVQGTTSAQYAVKNYDLQFKGGFDMANGSHVDNYHLKAGDIPFNRFVLKADVASSEGINNVELVKGYNDTCPYKTPAMVDNPLVRWGIDGYPIVVFWSDIVTGEVKFIGKFNFNLPKRAPAPYGYDPESADADIAAMESWEFQNNRNALMLFQTDYFNEAMQTDPDTGETKEAWRFDYEARFPDDSHTDYSMLQEFQTFVYSTWRAEATGDALSEPITYEGTTYTNDTADYRLAKFRNEFGNIAELDSFIFYYIYTELFLLMDSRAKNLFIGFNGSPITGHVIKRKATAQPYDMDSAMGTNNEGTLTYGYSLEDTDGEVFTGHGSVLWDNIRDAFPTEIRQMYQTLRSSGTLSYEVMEGRFEAHQSVWPEAIWIEDAWIKYLNPLIASGTKQPTSMYLSMLQGDKKQQRKWWLINRFRYMDSKWHAGEAVLNPIYLRAYAKGNVTVTPYFDIYPSVRYGSYTVSERGQAGRAAALICPSEISTFYDTEVYIYSAPQIALIGDLSPLKLGLADLSTAVHLQEIKIGDADANYDNRNLYQLDFGANVLLKKIDVRNCSGLGDTTLQGHSQTTVDISGCSIIEEAYFEGTKLTGVTLPNGGNLKKLHLPDTITNLTVLNQKNITEFILNDYSNIRTLRIENSSSVIPVDDILAAIPAGSRVRLMGFTMTASTTQEVEDFYDYLDTMIGMDEQGGNMDKAQVEGVITGLGTITGAWYAEMLARYPYIRLVYEHISSTVKFYNGGTLLDTQTATDGGNVTYGGTTPTKAQDAQYTYSFAGWSKGQDDNTVDDDALQKVEADRNVYACYTGTIRKYTVTFVKATADGGGTLQTISDVNYGTVITAARAYTGETPTTSQGSAEDYPFEGWEPASATVRGNTVFTAKFGNPVEVAEITDSWDTIIANIDNGTYKTKYAVGNYKPLDLGSEGTVNMQIAAIDKDIDANGDTVPLTFISGSLVSFGSYRYSSSIENWSALTTFRANLESEVASRIPSSIFNRIVLVRKISCGKQNGEFIQDIQTIDKVWIPSFGELAGTGPKVWFERTGVDYESLFNAIGLIKQNKSGVTASYGTRSGYDSASSYIIVTVLENGSWGNGTGSSERYLIGFCLGLEKESISDDWSTILANPNYSTDYSIGDTKEITVNGEKHLMEIVGFDLDDKADGTGKAKISWLMKGVLDEQHVMEPSAKAVDWGTSEGRNWLRNTILPTIDTTIRSHIVEVTKTYATGMGNQTVTNSTSDSIFLPSTYEMYGHNFGLNSNRESSGVRYTASVIPFRHQTRSSNINYTNFYASTIYADSGSGSAQNLHYFRIGFCTN